MHCPVNMELSRSVPGLSCRITGQLSGFRVYQELTRVCCDCRRTEYNFIYVTELKFSREKSQRESSPITRSTVAEAEQTV
jgi:hypothetical protein